MSTVHTIDELKSLMDPLAVYQDYIRLTRRGHRSVGLCPFHKEKTPSFSVDLDNGLFYCFGCHKGGDLIQFVQEMESCSFREAVELLARKAGVELALAGRGPVQAPDRRGRLLALLESAASYYHRALTEAPPGSPVRLYLRKRDIRPETEKRLRLGFAPPAGGLVPHLRREGFTPDEAAEAGLLLDNSRRAALERFRNRLLFPIRDAMGRVVGFGGRALGDEEPKYLNSPETPVFRKREILYGLDESKGAIRAQEEAVVVEGYMDFLAVTQAGEANAVATLGTALADGQVRALKRYARRVVLNFDRDPAGVAAAQRAILLLLAEGLRIRVVSVPDGKYPDEFIRHHGAEAYHGLVEKAEPFFDFLVGMEEQRGLTRDSAGKVAFLDHLTDYLCAVPDPIERQELAKEVAGRLGVDHGLILKRLAKRAVGEKREAPVQAGPVAGLAVAEQVLVKSLLAFPERAEQRLKSLPDEALKGLAVGPLIESLRLTGQPRGPEQTALLAMIQNGCHAAASGDDLAGAVARIWSDYLRGRQRRIQEQIREASLRKDLALVQILNREKMAVIQQMQTLEH